MIVLNSGNTQRVRLVGVDILRFLAAFMVAVFHLGYWSWAPKISTPRSILSGRAEFPFLVDFSWWGWVGVPIFFVISGFLISFSASNSTPRGFLEGRFLRLFPAALICATITLCVAIAIAWQPLDALVGMYVRSIAFWPFGPWIDGVYWTLAIELSFYGLVYILLLAGRFRWLENIMITIGLLSTAAWVLCFLAVSPASAPRIPGINARVSELLLIRHGMYFAIGTVLWAGAFYGWSMKRIVTITILTFGGLLPIISDSINKTASDETISVTSAPVLIWLFSLALLFAAVAWRKRFEKLFSPRLAAAITLAGLATYPFYLLHDVVGAACMKALIDLGVVPDFSLWLAIAAMIALSIFVTATPEKKLRSWIRRKIQTGNRRLTSVRQ